MHVFQLLFEAEDLLYHSSAIMITYSEQCVWLSLSSEYGLLQKGPPPSKSEIIQSNNLHVGTCLE
jgi:hypothetical protein